MKQLLIILFAAISINAFAQVELVSGGTGAAYTVTFPGVFTYTNGISVTFRAHTANADAATLNISSLGAKPLKKQAGTDLAANDILSDQFVTVFYDGTNFQVTSALGSAYSPPAWTLAGNNNTDPAQHFIGTADNKDLVIKTANQQRVKIDADGKLHLSSIPYIPHGSTADRILTIDADGVIKKMPAAEDADAKTFIPHTRAGTLGTPVQFSSASGRRVQNLYLPAELGSPTQQGSISTVYFTRNTTTALTIPDFEIYIGQPPVSTTEFTTNMDNNFTNANAVRVFGQAEFIIPAGNAGDWVAFPLTTTFPNYDPARPVFVETRFTGNANPTTWQVRYGSADPANTNRKVQATTPTASTGTLNTLRAFFRFDVTPSLNVTSSLSLDNLAVKNLTASSNVTAGNVSAAGNLTALAANFAGTVSLDSIAGNKGSIGSLKGTQSVFTTVNGTNGTISTLTGTNSTYTNLNGTNGNISALKGDTVSYTRASMIRVKGTTTNFINVLGDSAIIQGDSRFNGVTIGRGKGNIATNTVLGAGALSANTSGNNNVAIGYNVLSAITSGSNNVAIGSGALLTNTGSGNTAIGKDAMLTSTGSDNTAIGKDALRSITSGIGNVAIGVDAMRTSTSGLDNVAIGREALMTNTGNNNTAVGHSALRANTTGTSNVAIGRNALLLNTGSDNTAIGRDALSANTSGTRNVAIGKDAMMANIGSDNTAIGSNALRSNTGGVNNVAIGGGALQANTWGGNNVAIGKDALQDGLEASSSVAIGTNALRASTAGVGNVAIGGGAMQANATGNSCVAIGQLALYNSTGSDNTAVGYSALYANTTGEGNLAIGKQALSANTNGSKNQAIGMGALVSNTSGSNNVAFGEGALNHSLSGSNNTSIGHLSGFGSSGVSTSQSSFLGSNSFVQVNRTNVTMMGYGLVNGLVNNNNEVMLGNTAVTKTAANTTLSLHSDGRHKADVQADVKGLDFITRLRPVTYYRCPLELYKIWGVSDEELAKLNIDHTDVENQRTIGFIAQEVEEAMKASGFQFTGIDIPRNEKEVYSLRYTDFVMPLVKAVQELNTKLDSLSAAGQLAAYPQNSKLEQDDATVLKAQNRLLQQQVERMERQMETLQDMVRQMTEQNRAFSFTATAAGRKESVKPTD